MIRRHPLGSYFVLATGITTTLLLPIILYTQGLNNLAVPRDWHAVGALGPIVAACIVVATLYGRPGLSNYLRSLFNSRFPVWLFVLAVVPLLLFVLVHPVMLLLGRPQVHTVGGLSFGWWLSVIISSVAYGVGEEAGWRGFALPRLQARFPALTAVFVLTVFHALWHLPFFFYRMDLGLVGTIGFFIGMFAGAICLAFLYNQSGGKTLLPVLWHTTLNVMSLLAFATIPETGYVITSLFMVFAVAIVIIYKPAQLAGKARHTIRDSRPWAAPETLMESKG